RPAVRAPLGPQGLRGLVDLDVGVYSDVHARIVADRRRNELVAGTGRHYSGQSDRTAADGFELTRRHQVWHSFSDLLPRVIWNLGRQRAGAIACARRLRLVRNPVVDRWLGDLQDRRDCNSLVESGRSDPGVEYQYPSARLLPGVLGDQHAGGLSRHRLDSLVA